MTIGDGSIKPTESLEGQAICGSLKNIVLEETDIQKFQRRMLPFIEEWEKELAKNHVKCKYNFLDGKIYVPVLTHRPKMTRYSQADDAFRLEPASGAIQQFMLDKSEVITSVYRIPIGYAYTARIMNTQNDEDAWNMLKTILLPYKKEFFKQQGFDENTITYGPYRLCVARRNGLFLRDMEACAGYELRLLSSCVPLEKDVLEKYLGRELE